MTQQTFIITGMTCGHCVASVTEEVSAIPSVQDVQVDLDTHTLSFRSPSPIDEAVVRAAVEEAGYGLPGARDLPLV